MFNRFLPRRGPTCTLPKPTARGPRPSTTLSHQLHRRKGQKLWSHGGAILAGEADDNINDKFAMDVREAVRGGGATPGGGVWGGQAETMRHGPRGPWGGGSPHTRGHQRSQQASVRGALAWLFPRQLGRRRGPERTRGGSARI